MAVSVRLSAASNFEKTSAQHKGIIDVDLVCEWVDFDWGSLALVPPDEKDGGEDGLYVLDLYPDVLNEMGEEVPGQGWIVRIPKDQRSHAFSVWPQLKAVEGCTFARVYIDSAEPLT